MQRMTNLLSVLPAMHVMRIKKEEHMTIVINNIQIITCFNWFEVLEFVTMLESKGYKCKIIENST